MAKSEYRGEDATLELIRAHAMKSWDESIPVDKNPDVASMWQMHWSLSCESLAAEMDSEGLKTTAEAIRGYSMKFPKSG